MTTEPKPAKHPAVVCGADTSKKVPGQRYVYAHTSCKNRTTHESGRCHLHRYRGTHRYLRDY